MPIYPNQCRSARFFMNHMAIPDLVEDSSACHLVLIFTHVPLIAQKNLSQMRSGYDRAVSSFSSHYAHISHECFAEVLAGQSNSLRSRGNCTAFSDYQRVREA